MKLICSTPAAFARVSDLDEWFRHPYVSMPALGRFWSNLGEALPRSQPDRLAVDVHEDKDAYHASFEVPGIKKENVKIELNDGRLTISAEKRMKTGETENSLTLSRTISVPEGINIDAITAKLEDGLLRVTLPKAEHRKPRQIELN